ncbi:MAG: DUF423 domain-containing protein [Myxococcales bacterium]|nr:DUF423 domain-containing protein [Myxococcales bacterium]
MSSWQRLFSAGAALVALAIVAGAFGAHALRDRLTSERLAVFETGARYHMYGALGVLALALAVERGVADTRPGWLLIAGTAIFAGSLYALALSGVKVLGAITPIGGAAMIAAWLWVAIRAVRA